MKLLVGLGNPGPKYELTRHNIGFLLIDRLADENRVSVGQSKFDGLFGKGSIFGQDIVFLKPQTYMNLSGKSVVAALKFFKIPLADLIVLHDDIDLEAGKVKVKMNGGHGGHNGIRNIVALGGSGDFARIKLGVGRPAHGKVGVSDWVLDRLTDEELDVIEQQMFETVCERLKSIL